MIKANVSYREGFIIAVCVAALLFLVSGPLLSTDANRCDAL
jgi:hypothetical protein